MKRNLWSALVVCVAVSMWSESASGSDVLLLTGDLADGQAYAELLQGSGMSVEIVAPSDFAAAKSGGARLVVCLRDCGKGPWVQPLFEFGQQYKVLTIGTGGADILGTMELLIGNQHGWYDDRLPKNVLIPREVLQGPLRAVFREPFDFLYDNPSELQLRLHDGPGQLAQVGIYDDGRFPKGTVGIALEVSDGDHWALLKQGNFTLWGCDSRAGKLTEQGRALFVNLCWYLLNCPSEPLLFPEKRFVGFGTTQGTLVGDIRDRWYFSPDEPGTVVFTLAWDEPNTMMFLIREPYERRDGTSPLTIEMSISRSEVGKPKSISVTSFSLEEGRSCPYTIRVERGAALASETDVQWETDFRTALESARRSSRPVIVLMTAPWCSWCRKLESESCQDVNVKDALSKFVCVKAVEDKEVEGRFGCDGYPTIIFLDSSGSEVHRFSGYKGPDDFLEELNSALTKIGRR